MTVIPPNWMSSILGGHGAQGRAAEIKRKEAFDEAVRTGKVETSQGGGSAIETADRDTEVDSDAEGAGSQGRASEQDASSENNEPADTSVDISADASVDVSADTLGSLRSRAGRSIPSIDIQV